MSSSSSANSSSSFSSAKRSYAACARRNATLSSIVPTKSMTPRHTIPADKNNACGTVTKIVAIDHINTVIPMSELMSSSMDSRK